MNYVYIFIYLFIYILFNYTHHLNINGKKIIDLLLSYIIDINRIM